MSYELYKGKIIGGLSALENAEEQPGKKQALKELRVSFIAMTDELEAEQEEEAQEEAAEESTSTLNPDFLTEDFYKNCNTVAEAVLLFCQAGNYSENAVRKACGIAAETWRKAMKNEPVYRQTVNKIRFETGIPEELFTITKPQGRFPGKSDSQRPLDEDNGDWIAGRKKLNDENLPSMEGK